MPRVPRKSLGPFSHPAVVCARASTERARAHTRKGRERAHTSGATQVGALRRRRPRHTRVRLHDAGAVFRRRHSQCRTSRGRSAWRTAASPSYRIDVAGAGNAHRARGNTCKSAADATVRWWGSLIPLPAAAAAAAADAGRRATPQTCRKRDVGREGVTSLRRAHSQDEIIALRLFNCVPRRRQLFQQLQRALPAGVDAPATRRAPRRRRVRVGATPTMIAPRTTA